MKYLKNLSLFKIAIFLILNIYFQNILMFVLSLLFILLTSKKDIFIFIILMVLIIFSNILNIDLIPLGIVEEKTDNYVIIDKLFYKEMIYADLNIGDVIIVRSQNKVEEKSLLKYNYRYKEYNGDNIEIIFSLSTRKFTHERLDSFSEDSRAFLKRILFNTYSENAELEYLGYGFAFYYILLTINRKNKYICILFLIIYYLFYGFDIKFYLIITDIILNNKIKGTDKLCIKIIIILIINYHLLLNNSILLSFIFSFFYNSELKEDKSLVLVIQSFFFYETNVLSIFIYKYLIKLRIILFIISLSTFFIASFIAIIIISSNISKSSFSSEIFSFNFTDITSLLPFILTVTNSELPSNVISSIFFFESIKFFCIACACFIKDCIFIIFPPFQLIH